MNKELKKMSRQELIELLLAQSKAMDELTLELTRKEELLEERNIKISECGSIAEASLKINDVFESCQRACNQYLDSIKVLRDEEMKIKEELESNLKKAKDEKKKIKLEKIKIKDQKSNLKEELEKFNQEKEEFKKKKESNLNKKKSTSVKDKTDSAVKTKESKNVKKVTRSVKSKKKK